VLYEVIQDDAVEGMQGIADESVDVVLTDPPFSSGTRREASKGLRKSMTRGTDDKQWFGSDSLTINGFFYLIRLCALEWSRVMKPGAHALVFIDWRMMATLAPAVVVPTYSAAIESADLRHAGMLVWNKTYFGMGTTFRNQYELILHFSKGVGREPFRRDVGNVLDFAPIRDGLHPTEKPVDLLRCLLSVVCPPDGLVLDCFAGSGSTGEACVPSYKFIGVEREPPYVEMARARILRAQGVPATIPRFPGKQVETPLFD
jgi:site-specific DNA-methyltransferase (adenine-specific)